MPRPIAGITNGKIEFNPKKKLIMLMLRLSAASSCYAATIYPKPLP